MEEINEKEEGTEKIVPKKKKYNQQIAFPWDISNFSFNYSLLNYRDINTRQDLKKYLGSVNYLYNGKVKPFEPFKKILFKKVKMVKIDKRF